jgi:uncharacterized membrane protein
MDLRPALDELAAQHALSPANTARLHALAGNDPEPANLGRSIPMGVALLAAVLGGMGIIFWIAANWSLISRSGRFALLQGVVVLMCAAAIWSIRARVPLSLLACLAIGALFAFFGQTYQTGADPWQLFALWAALSLPLCIGVRHDALWSLWALIAATAIVLWTQAHTGHTWRALSQDTWAHVAAWTMAVLVAIALHPALTRHTGAGIWSMRITLAQLAVMVTFASIWAIFQDDSSVMTYWLGLLVLVCAAAAFTTAFLHDTFALSVFGLSVNIILISGLVEFLFRNKAGGEFGLLLLIATAAAVLLAATVSFVMQQARRHGQGDAA